MKDSMMDSPKGPHHEPRYEIDIFYSAEDEGYIANVPELTYCSAWGDTYEEALAQVRVAMKLHLETLREEGRPIPEPATRSAS
jgi:predicted RNase H-like HicB family nuclease